MAGNSRSVTHQGRLTLQHLILVSILQPQNPRQRYFRNLTVANTTVIEESSSEMLLPIPVNSPTSDAASTALQQLTRFRSLTIVSHIGSTRLIPLNPSQQVTSTTFSPRLRSDLNSSESESSDKQTFLASLRSIGTIVPSDTSLPRKSSETPSSNIFSPLSDGELNPNSPRSSFTSPTSILLFPTTGSRLLSGGAIAQTSSHILSLSPSATLVSSGADPLASSYLSTAQSSTLLPTTTETSLRSGASLETLFSGSYTSNQWITTIRPGSSTETVVPIILPPGQHNPIVL